MKWTWMLITAMLAGCAESGTDAPDEDAFALDDELEATATTGIIRGVVLTPTIQPIVNATVTLVGTEFKTATNAEGLFGFGGLEPGTYFLEAKKAGFNSTQATAFVVADVDKPDIVKILLNPDPSTAPYIQEDVFHGILVCSLSYIALCGAASGLTGDQFLKRVPLDGQPDWLQMEAVWESTQLAGDAMNLQMSYGGGGPGQTCCTNKGISPLMVFANQTTVDEHDIGNPHDLVVRMFVWEIPGTGIDDHTGMCIPVVLTTYCQGPGAALDQEFEVFSHMFYNFQPPEGWRYTDSGKPTPS